MKVLTVSDSFKGTLSSSLIGELVSEHYAKEGHETSYIPISDGGEGFLDVIKYIKKLEFLSITVKGPYFKDTQAKYLYDEVDKTAYVELAETSGLPKVKKEDLRAPFASTYGLGELIKHIILKHQPKKVVMGIGGSATTDVGSGMLEAMGVEFIERLGFKVTGLNNAKLMQARKLNTKKFQKLIKGIEFVTLTDVENPLLGSLGTVSVFAPQKGATEEDQPVMERNVQHFYNLTNKLHKKNAPDFKGAGAAGGVGYAMKYFFNSKITSGIEEILRLVEFDKLVEENDVIITGEGSFDSQSLNGKVISGIQGYNPKRLVIICGRCKIENPEVEVYPIVPSVATAEESMGQPKESLLKLLNTIKL